jgi:N-acetylglutamate synthase-like GNAT family acetyltransferase
MGRLDMGLTIRHAKSEDAQAMLQVYNNFTKQFVGSASRSVSNFRTLLRGKDNINWAALDSQNRVVGYISTRLEKRVNRGEFREIIVDPKHDFEKVAKMLVEKACAFFTEKKVSSIRAGSLRNPAYETLFPKLGFFESEENDVFMYAILNVQKFLNEMSPVFINRLKQLQNWSGLAQLECEGQSLFLQKTAENVEPVVWTNQPVGFRISSTRELLTKLVFGIADPVELWRTGQLKMKSTESSERADLLLETMFPRLQFLIMDFW